MSTGYFAQVTDGVVSDVRRVTAERIEQNPDLYPGNWVEVLDMDHYPALGWVWTAESGLQPPPEEVVIE
jgi:hypothetical protein